MTSNRAKGASKIGSQNNFETISPATKLLEKRRKMYEIHEEFNEQKVEFKKKEELFRDQEQQIKDKDQTIQMELIEVCRYLQDTELKKTRAEQKYNQELIQKEKRESEIINLRSQIVNLEKEQKKLEKRVSALKKYDDYLENVLKNHAEQYGDFNDIINSNQDLKDEQRDLEDQIQEISNQEKMYKAKKTHEILSINNENKNLQKKQEELRQDKQKIESNVEESNKQSSTKNLDLGRIFMAVDNLYDRCNDGIQHIKQKYEERANQNKLENKVEKKEEKKQFVKADTNDENNEDNFVYKARKAVERLGKIKNWMIDFRQIINQCKAEQIKEK